MFKLPENSRLFEAETCSEMVAFVEESISEELRMKRELGLEFPLKRPEHYITVRVKSTWYYLKCVEALQTKLGHRNRMIYRGHADANYELTPTIMRRQLYGKVPTSDQVDRTEIQLIANFQRRGRPFLKVLPYDRDEHWEWVALAQHHRLPTRFLDWTLRAAVALYFAVDARTRAPSAPLSCIWAILAPKEIFAAHRRYPGTVDTVYLYNPPHISPRIIAQQACFTVHPSHYIDKYYKWIEGPRVIFLVAAEDRDKVLLGLSALGVNHASMFPDLDGIADFIVGSFDPADI